MHQYKVVNEVGHYLQVNYLTDKTIEGHEERFKSCKFIKNKKEATTFYEYNEAYEAAFRFDSKVVEA